MRPDPGAAGPGFIRTRATVPITPGMSRFAALGRRLRFVTVTPDTERAYDLSKNRVHQALRRSERLSMVSLALGFPVAAGVLFALAPPGPVPVAMAAMLVVSLAVLSRVELALAS